MSSLEVSVAMATYNGSKYIAEQLESLLRQSHLPFELVVCDDGSTDETVDIVQRFAKEAPFPVRIFQNERNLGYAENFLKAASLCSGDWVSFCDQDDVWLPNKIEDVRTAISRDPRAVMVVQNAYICAADLSHRGRLFPDRLRPGFYPPGSQFGFWVWVGFLQTFKRSMLNYLGQEKRPTNYFPGFKVMSHDKWTCMIANATGGVSVLSKPAALYRRHDKSLTGAYAIQTMTERVGKSLPVSSDHYSFLSGVAEEMASYLLRLAERSEGLVAADLRLSAEGFSRIAKIHNLRALIYAPSVSSPRIFNFVQIALNGGYIGPKMVALGWKSAVKDLFRSLGLLPFIQRICR